jgi:hypothetical protein
MTLEQAKNLFKTTGTFTEGDGPYYSRKDVIRILDQIEDEQIQQIEVRSINSIRDQFLERLNNIDLEDYEFDKEDHIFEIELGLYDRTIEIERIDIDYKSLDDEIRNVVKDIFAEMK